MRLDLDQLPAFLQQLHDLLSCLEAIHAAQLGRDAVDIRESAVLGHDHRGFADSQ